MNAIFSSLYPHLVPKPGREMILRGSLNIPSIHRLTSLPRFSQSQSVLCPNQSCHLRRDALRNKTSNSATELEISR